MTSSFRDGERYFKASRADHVYGTGPHKDAGLISCAFTAVHGDLRQTQWFHTDRGSEFKNQTIPVFVMVLPHNRSFCYSQDDLKVIERFVSPRKLCVYLPQLDEVRQPQP
ncbi:hypothetical protein D3C72_1268680 [compost metagenome]